MKRGSTYLMYITYMLSEYMSCRSTHLMHCAGFIAENYLIIQAFLTMCIIWSRTSKQALAMTILAFFVGWVCVGRARLQARAVGTTVTSIVTTLLTINRALIVTL